MRLPLTPGVYLMKNDKGKIIYVGKAKNLRHRVLGYFRPGARHAPKVRSMVNTVADFEFMTVKNEAEALLTEASLIKKYKPHFNILMRDDKRYLLLKLDMSVDRYRSNKCIDAVRDVVLAVASDPQFKHTKIRLMSCALDAQMANERVLIPDFFASRGIELKFENRSWFNPYFQVCYANNTRIVIHEEGPTMRIGRAKQNNIGYKIYYPQLQCGGLQPEHTLMELSLREDGMIKWHNWYDWDIMVPYKDADGQYKSLPQIRAELVDMVWPRLLRHNIKNTVLNLLPIYGDIRQIYINKQIQKTYEENRKNFVHHAVSIKEL